MNPRLRTNLLLAAVVAMLGVIVWLAPESKKGVPVHALFDANSAITGIEVLDRGKPHLALALQEGRWHVAAPFELPADDFQVDALLDSLREPATRRYPADSANLAELGLENPRWTLRVDDVQIRLGDRGVLGNTRYLLKDGFVYLVNDVLSYRLQRAPLDYASRLVVPQEKSIAALWLPDGTHLARTGTTWQLQPDDAAMTTDTLIAIVNAWRNAAALDVQAAHSVPRDGEVQIEFADGSAVQFGIEISDTGLLLTRDNPAITYTLPRDAVGELLQLTPREPE